jgi:hypothetical protein
MVGIFNALDRRPGPALGFGLFPAAAEKRVVDRSQLRATFDDSEAVRALVSGLMRSDFPVDFLRCFEEAMASSDLPLFTRCS